MYQQFEHHRAGPKCDCPYVPLGNAVLMVGTNSTQGDLLILEFHVFEEVTCSEREVVCMVTSNLDAIVVTEAFKFVFTNQSFSNAE